MSAAGRSRTTIKRHEAELNAFARFLQARGQDLPTEVDCLDFVAQRSGCRLAGLREPASSRQAQLARRPLVVLMECLDGGMPRVGQATSPLADVPADVSPPRTMSWSGDPGTTTSRLSGAARCHGSKPDSAASRTGGAAAARAGGSTVPCVLASPCGRIANHPATATATTATT